MKHIANRWRFTSIYLTIACLVILLLAATKGAL